MWGMQEAFLKNLLESQADTLKKIKVELCSGKTGQKKLCRIKGHSIKKGTACLTLKDTKTGEIFKLNFIL